MNICLILGLLCLVYGLIVAIAGSGGTKFFIVWIGIAVILFVLAGLLMSSGGIAKRLTTHVARHTAATVVFLANDVSMENVSKILGHSNIRMTQHYAKVLDSSIMRDMANVERNFIGK